MGIGRRQGGFSLAETLATVVIGAATLIAVLMVYRRVEDSATATHAKLDESRVPTEVLQRIAEDLDKVISTGPDTKIIIESGFEKGLPKSQLTITRTFMDATDVEQVLDEVKWIPGYDYDRDIGTMILYRGHTGLSYEDKLLDSQRSVWESEYPLVPMCAGVTYFRIEIPRGNDVFQDTWNTSALPTGVRVTISFAEPFETVSGTLDVPESSKYSRTIAIDRTREIRFELAPSVVVGDVNTPEDGGDDLVEDTEMIDEDADTGAATKENEALRNANDAEKSRRP